MALFWTVPATELDGELTLAPERYTARASRRQFIEDDSEPLTNFVVLQKATFDPAKPENLSKHFKVLDTTHAYEGRIQVRAGTVVGRDVGSLKRPLKAGSVIVSRLRTYLRQIAYIDEAFVSALEPPTICSTEFYVLEPSAGHDIAFLVPFLLTPEVQYAFAKATEGGHHPRIHSSVLLGLRVPRRIIDSKDVLSRSVREAIALIREAELRFAKAITASAQNEPEASLVGAELQGHVDATAA